MSRAEKTDISGGQTTKSDTTLANFVAVPREWGVAAGSGAELATNQVSSMMQRWMAEAPTDAPFHAVAMVAKGSVSTNPEIATYEATSSCRGTNGEA